MLKLKLASFSVACLVTGCGFPQNEESKTKSVGIPQSEVENQLKIGFCWAYTGIGLVESNYKFQTGETINLSEEALGFYRMAEGLYYLSQNVRGQNLIDAISQDSLQGWMLGSKEVPDTFALLKKYGAVPEQVWTRKFKDAADTKSLVKAVKYAMLDLVSETPNPKKITIKDIVDKVLLTEGGWDSAPPSTFVYQNVRYTPQSFLEKLKFDPTQFESIHATAASDLDKIIAAAKRALVRGFSVPLGYPVNFARLNVDTFSGKDVDLTVAENFLKEGGHAVLIDDFVNVGGREGALPLDQVLKEYLRPVKDLDYFVFKNSWGTSATTNESGTVIRGSKTGYYKIDKEYLEGAANLSSQEELKGFLEIVVPKDIALDPMGDEKINNRVARMN